MIIFIFYCVVFLDVFCIDLLGKKLQDLRWEGVLLFSSTDGTKDFVLASDELYTASVNYLTNMKIEYKVQARRLFLLTINITSKSTSYQIAIVMLKICLSLQQKKFCQLYLIIFIHIISAVRKLVTLPDFSHQKHKFISKQLFT